MPGSWGEDCLLLGNLSSIFEVQMGVGNNRKRKVGSLAMIICWGKVGAILCSVRCLAPSLVFNQQIQVAACSPVFLHKDNCWVPRVLEGRISTGRAPLILAQMYILCLPRWLCMCLVLGVEMRALYMLLKCPTAKSHPSPWQLFFFWDRVSICSLGWPWSYTLLLLLLPNAETRVWGSIHDFRIYTLEFLFLTSVYSWVTKGFGFHHCLRIDMMEEMRSQVLFGGWHQLCWCQNPFWSLQWALSSCWLGQWSLNSLGGLFLLFIYLVLFDFIFCLDSQRELISFMLKGGNRSFLIHFILGNQWKMINRKWARDLLRQYLLGYSNNWWFCINLDNVWKCRESTNSINEGQPSLPNCPLWAVLSLSRWAWTA